MELIILGLKRKSDGKYLVYDVEGKNSVEISIGETKKINTLDPFPFSNFSSLDDERISLEKYCKCYLKVEADLSEKEYHSMKSSGIMYHRFSNRNITFLEEFEDIFQHTLSEFKKFDGQLSTYDLTTWVIHNETKNENEYEAMKQIIFEAVKNKKKNKEYPLDITLDKYTATYAQYFRELSEQGYYITFGRYGGRPRHRNDLKDCVFDADTFIYLLQKLYIYNPALLHHPMFTKEFYIEHILGQKIEKDIIVDLYDEFVDEFAKKDMPMEEIYPSVLNFVLEESTPEWYEYDSWESMFSDLEFSVKVEHTSPMDYYCCEDCDGYDIYEMYTDEELEGEYYEVDDRRNLLNKMLHKWENYLTDRSYHLFDFISTDVLKLYKDDSPFLSKMYEHRIKSM